MYQYYDRQIDPFDSMFTIEPLINPYDYKLLTVSSRNTLVTLIHHLTGDPSSKH